MISCKFNYRKTNGSTSVRIATTLRYSHLQWNLIWRNTIPTATRLFNVNRVHSCRWMWMCSIDTNKATSMSPAMLKVINVYSFSILCDMKSKVNVTFNDSTETNSSNPEHSSHSHQKRHKPKRIVEVIFRHANEPTSPDFNWFVAYRFHPTVFCRWKAQIQFHMISY